MGKMRANVFYGVNEFRVEEVEKPRAGIGEAVIRVMLTTICGTDLHIVRGEYPVRPGLTIGHEPVGVIEELGPGVTHLRRVQRLRALTLKITYHFFGRFAGCGLGIVFGLLMLLYSLACCVKVLDSGVPSM